jgi:transcriptional regulator with GAF, ATPase, and Fis domain
MRELFARVDRLAKSDSTVLVEAETGTGKELVARALHEASARAAGPYVIVDCAALPENLLESELFGHAKGAFTGAVGARAGAIEAADGGTVFLDEVGELPLAMQPKLLRAIESRQVRRLGETAYRKIDVRFVSATHRDLRTMVNSGAFREDLYFRLAVLPIGIPPLRSRVEDIGLLVQHFLGPNATEVIGADMVRELASRPWLGNVRELRNFVERARALGIREALSLSSPTREAQTIAPGEVSLRRSVPPPVPPQVSDEAERARLNAAANASAASGAAPSFSPDRPFREVREEWSDFVEREYLRRQLERHGRNIAAVAQAAGLDRTYVYKLIRRHDL